MVNKLTRKKVSMSKTATKPMSKTATKPISKTVTKPMSKTVTKPMSKTESSKNILNTVFKAVLLGIGLYSTANILIATNLYKKVNFFYKHGVDNNYDSDEILKGIELSIKNNLNFSDLNMNITYDNDSNKKQCKDAYIKYHPDKNKIYDLVEKEKLVNKFIYSNVICKNITQIKDKKAIDTLFKLLRMDFVERKIYPAILAQVRILYKTQS